MNQSNKLFALLAAAAVLASNAWAMMKGESSFRKNLSKVVKIQTLNVADGSICGSKPKPIC